jgi:toxin ParE1/3/4
MPVVLSERAEFDLFRIYRYIDERSHDAADAFLRRIDANFDNLARFPFIGRDRSSLARGLRCLVVGQHLIFYTIEPDQIVIVRIIDGRMDVEEEFKR